MIKKTRSHKKEWFIYLLTVMFLVFEMGVQVSPSVMTTALMHDLHLNTFQLGLMSGFYFYTYTAMQIPSGLLFDHHNPKIIISCAVFVCSLGALFFAFSANIYTAILARLLMGSGSAFAFISVLVVSADLFSHERFAVLTGITQMLAALGAMMGQIPLSSLVFRFGWRPVMIYTAFVGFGLTALIWLFVNYKRNLTPDTADRTYGIWQSLKNILQLKQTWLIALYAFLLWAPMSGFTSLWGIPYLETAFGMSDHQAAFLCSIMWVGLAVFSPILGWFSTALSRRKLPLWLSAFVGIIGFGLILFLKPSTSSWIIGIGIFAAGLACSGQALSFSLIKDMTHPKRKGTAIALNNMAVVISGAFFQPVIGKLLSVFQPDASSSTSLYSNTAFTYSLLLILGCYVLGFIIACFFLRETFCRSTY
jgi:MFS family permease